MPGGKVWAVLLGIVLAGFGAYLLLTGLGRPVLWADEAEESLLSRSVLSKGYPSSYDGKRIISIFEDRRESNSKYVWTYHPWAQFYAIGTSMALFGKDTRGARVLCSLAGWLSLFVVGVLSLRWSKTRGWAFLAPALLLANPTFLNYCRQAKYFGLVFLVVPCVFYCYFTWQVRQDRNRAVLLGLVLALLFHVNYFVFAVSLLVLLLHWLMDWKQSSFRLRSTFWLAWIIAFVLTYPWYAYYRPFPGRRLFARTSLWVSWLSDFFSQANDYVFPGALILVAIALRYWKRETVKGEEGMNPASVRRLLWLYIGIGTFLASIIPYHSFRFMIATLPCGALLATDILFRLWKRSRALGVLAVALLLLTTAFQDLRRPGRLFSKASWRPPLMNFLHERAHPRETLLECVIDFLKKNATPEETLLVEDPALPIIFYTDMKTLNAQWDYARKNADSADWIMETAFFSLNKLKWNLTPELLGLKERYSSVHIVCPQTSQWRLIPDPTIHGFGLKQVPRQRVTFYRKIHGQP